MDARGPTRRRILESVRHRPRSVSDIARSATSVMPASGSYNLTSPASALPRPPLQAKTGRAKSRGQRTTIAETWSLPGAQGVARTWPLTLCLSRRLLSALEAHHEALLQPHVPQRPAREAHRGGPRHRARREEARFHEG